MTFDSDGSSRIGWHARGSEWRERGSYRVFRYGGLSYIVDCCDKAGTWRLTISQVDRNQFDFWLTAPLGHTATSNSVRFRELDEVVYAYVCSYRRANLSPAYVGRKSK